MQSQEPRGVALIAVRALQRFADERLFVIVERHAFGQRERGRFDL